MTNDENKIFKICVLHNIHFFFGCEANQSESIKRVAPNKDPFSIDL